VHVGAGGDDAVQARDGARDRVACGPGRDRARVDRLDRVKGCERVDRPAAPAPEPTPTPSATAQPTATATASPTAAPTAPPLSDTQATSLHDATSFLFTGPDAPQKGVAPGTIDPDRIAVLRGTVRGETGAALEGVRVTVLDHPELGETATRADGGYDIAVNGGAPVVLVFERQDLLEAQLRVDTPWQDYVVEDPLVMVPLDPQVNTISQQSTAAFQVARGSLEVDADGERRATLLFPAGVDATMELPDGSTKPLGDLDVRATEYTVGSAGPAAMPGELPATSGYTYAVEYSVDEALQAGATDVRFDEPVITYTENLIGAPVGSAVPTGYYDREQGRWIASEDGLVIEVVGESGGLAAVDADRTAGADPDVQLQTLGITEAERRRLADLYDPGQQLWRVTVTHFTPWDYNWPYGPPAGAEEPPLGTPIPPEDDQCEQPGSVIRCEAQVLAETVPVTGTPFQLAYSSDRTEGHEASRVLEIPITGASVPSGVKGIILEVDVGGRHFEQRWEDETRFSTPDVPPIAPNLTHELAWDGRDAYGRPVLGRPIASVKVAYVYDAIRYETPETFETSFAALPSLSDSIGVTRCPIVGGIGFWELDGPFCGVGVQAEERTSLGAWDATGFGLGDWTLDAHHGYDPDEGALHRGDGSVMRAEALGPVLRRVAGGFDNLQHLAQAPDGSILVYDLGKRRILRIARDGVTTTVAGDGTSASGTCDGRPATALGLGGLGGMDVGPDGRLYLALNAAGESGAICRVRGDGTTEQIAGNGKGNSSDPGEPLVDGRPGPATRVGNLLALHVDRQGAVWWAENLHWDGSGGRRIIRQLGQDGLVRLVAGGGTDPTAGEDLGAGEAATDHELQTPRSLATAADGTLYLADYHDDVVQRVTVDGRIQRVAGNGTQGTWFEGFSGPAAEVPVGSPISVAVTDEGSVLIRNNVARDFVREVDEKGFIRPFAGHPAVGGAACSNPDGHQARGACSFQSNGVIGIDAAPDGSVLVGDPFRVWRVRSPLPEFGASSMLVAEPDGSLTHEFSASGRHLRTRDGLTGAVRYAFEYDAAGRLATVRDAAGLETTIERDATGAATAVVAPGGQRTELQTGGDGRLSAIANPAGETVRMEYDAGGLLTALTDPRGGVSRFAYDSRGRLVRHEDPAGAVRTLARFADPSTRRVTVTSAEGRQTVYERELLEDGRVRRTVREPGGAETVAVEGLDGGVTVRAPEGTETEIRYGPDPRFGGQAPVAREFVQRLPGGGTRTVSVARSATFADPADPLSLQTLSEQRTENGRTTTTAYDAATRRLTITTPAGRVWRTVFDAAGRPVEHRLPGVAQPITVAHDSHGRISEMRQGPESETYAYDGRGRVTTVTQSGGRVTTLTYDDADQMVSATLPGGRTYGYGYDATGNRTQITMPSGAVHTLGYDAAGQLERYSRPGGDAQLWRYDSDRHLTRTDLASGRSITTARDAGGRPTAQAFPETQASAEYAAGDATRRIDRLRWDRPGGAIDQEIDFDFDGPLVTRQAFSGAANGAFSFEYDADLEVTRRELQSGPDTVTDLIEHDGDGLVTRVGPFTLDRSGALGAAKAVTDGTASLALTQDDLGRRDTTTLSVAAKQAYALKLTRDARGLITQRVETIAGTTRTYEYAYDAGDQLTQVTRDGAVVETYTYDANGNRSSGSRDGGPLEAALYDERDRLVSRGGTAYTFDADGFMTGRGSDTFAYSPSGELLAATVGGETITYDYDGSGRRTARTDQGGRLQYLYGNPRDPLEVSATRSPAGVLTTYYYDDLGHLVALERAGQRYYVASDQVGSPRVVTDAAGAAVKVVDYDAFGRIRSDSAPGFPLPIGYAGGISDPATGLVRFGARDYEPESGRWTAGDPILFDGGQANLYAYVGSEPVGRRDPTGLVFRAGACCITHWDSPYKKRLGLDDYGAAVCHPLRKDLKEVYEQIWEVVFIVNDPRVTPAAREFYHRYRDQVLEPRRSDLERRIGGDPLRSNGPPRLHAFRSEGTAMRL
jgi:RHS repeat-associated protein